MSHPRTTRLGIPGPLLDDPAVQRMTAAVRIRKLPISQFTDIDGAPNDEFIAATNSYFNAHSTNMPERHVEAVPRAVLHVAYRTPEWDAVARTTAGQNIDMLVSVTSANEIAVRASMIVANQLGLATPDVQVDITPDGDRAGSGRVTYRGDILSRFTYEEEEA